MLTGQDFGITKTNAKRLSEFLDYFINKATIDPCKCEELLDIILKNNRDILAIAPNQIMH